MPQVSKSNHLNLKAHAIGMIGILTAEYLLGITVDFFVPFPEDVHGGELWQFAWRQIPIALHIILGILLLGGTIALLVRAIRYKNRIWIKAGTLAMGAVVGAIVGGALFIPSQTDIYSFIMAVCFIIALLAYFWGLYANRQ